MATTIAFTWSTTTLALALWAAAPALAGGEPEHGEDHQHGDEPSGRATMFNFIDAGIPNDPAEGGTPSELGQWAAPVAWPVVAIHAAVMPTGEVLHYSWPAGGTGSRARLWNPVTNTFTNVDIADDIFCSGHTHLGDGRLYVAGGNNSGCDFRGILDTNLFDPVTRKWSPLQNMANGRWYPTNELLPDGRVLIFTGLNQTCSTNTSVEMYTPGTGPGTGLSLVPEGTRLLQLYPRMHVLPSGKIAHVGPENAAWTFELGVGWQHIDNSSFGWRSQGTAVPVPGEPNKIMTLCGNSPLTLTTEIIDFAQPSPQFAYGPSINFTRGHANALILPDKTILLVGGGQDGLYGMPVITPELYDPATKSWTQLPSHVHGRMYHSTLVLLPDGRALSAGQDNGPGAMTAEIYSPRYLFRGARPEISSVGGGVSTTILYGQTFSITTPQAADIASVVLIKLSSVTHSMNFTQRLVDVSYSLGGAATLNATAPPSANLAPPGYYLLFILNSDQVPSIGAMVKLAPPGPGDVNRDGLVNIDDLLGVINGWGTCGSPDDPPDAPPGTCLADVHPYSVVVSGNGIVNIDDLLLVINNWG
jgi:hypothetical protein